jgi:hypothetical protein
LGLFPRIAIAAEVVILFLLLYKKKDSQKIEEGNGVENSNFQNQRNDVETQKDSRIKSQSRC